MPEAGTIPASMRHVLSAMAFCLLAPSLLLAWGGDGHQIVCLIAEDRLTPTAKGGIRELLGPDANISDAEIAVWADQIRRERPNTAPWHYVNIPTSRPTFDAVRDGHNGNNVIAKIEQFEKVLADKTRPKAERAEALKFLVHFVGDIHQPLHCVDRDGDRGGNGRLVFFLNQRRAVNLHQVWDTQILLYWKGRTSILNYARTLNTMIAPGRAMEWSKGTPKDWANESHRVAIEQVYRDVPVDGDPPKLGADYIERAGAVIDVQLQKAGIRLAAILNRSFRAP